MAFTLCAWLRVCSVWVCCDCIMSCVRITFQEILLIIILFQFWNEQWEWIAGRMHRKIWSNENSFNFNLIFLYMFGERQFSRDVSSIWIHGISSLFSDIHIILSQSPDFGFVTVSFERRWVVSNYYPMRDAWSFILHSIPWTLEPSAISISVKHSSFSSEWSTKPLNDGFTEQISLERLLDIDLHSSGLYSAPAFALYVLQRS